MATVAAHRVQFPYSLDLSRRSSRGVDDRLRKKSEHAARRRWKKSGRRVSTRCRHVPRWPKGRNLFFHRTFRYAFIDWRRAVLSPPASTSSATDVRFGQMTPRSPRPWHDLGIQTPDRNCGPGWRAPSRVFLDLLGGEKKEREDPSLVCPSHLSLSLSLSFRFPSPSTTHRVPRSPRRSMLLSWRRRGGIAPFLERVLSGLFDDGGVAAATVTRMK